MHKITELHAREILDSRGNPTIEVDMILESKAFGRAAVPSGASTGIHEAVELKDNDPKRYGGKGVLQAVKNVNEVISASIKGTSFDQRTLDETLIKLDGTENKGKLGANAILGVSMAFARTAAQCENKALYRYFAEIANTGKPMQMPVPMMNVLNGGKHAENSTDLQEFMIVPAGATTFHEALRFGAETFHALKKILAAKKLNTSVGDEGGYAPSLPSNEAALQVIVEAIEKAGFVPGKDIYIAIDAAASEFYDNGSYKLTTENKVLNAKELGALYGSWLEKYPIVSIEDGFAEDDWDGYQAFTETWGKKIQIVGDDLFVTNVKRIEEGIAKKAANAILIKLNQIGTVSETIDAINLGNKNNFNSIVSHRSGETEDTTIADFVVGLGCGQIKTGSLSRSERIAKYNQLLRIEEELGSNAIYPGVSVFKKE